MTLNNDPTKPPEQPTPETEKKKPQNKPKLTKAIELAQKYIDLPYAAAKQRIMEETPCVKSTAHKAYHLVHDKPKTQTPTSTTPTLNVINEPDKTPTFLPEGGDLQPPEAPALSYTNQSEAPILAALCKKYGLFWDGEFFYKLQSTMILRWPHWRTNYRVDMEKVRVKHNQSPKQKKLLPMLGVPQ